jgi:uncharacterized membrane protein
MQHPLNPIKKLLLMFIVLEILFASILFYSSYTQKYICLPGFDCKAVETSEYGSILGIKLSVLGLIAFPALLVVFLLSLSSDSIKKFFLFSALAGAIFAAYFIYVQTFLLKKFCSSCLAIDSLMIIICFASIHEYLKYGKYE